MISYQFNSCWVHVKPEEGWIGNFFPDGTVAHARPQFREEDFARAAALGYGDDVWQMNVDHELYHTAMAELAGEGHSRVLWAAAHGTLEQMDIEWAFTEESRVLGAQKEKPIELINYVEKARINGCRN